MATVLCAAFVVYLIIFIGYELRRISEFNDRFPPISDAEFLACYRPDTDPEIALRVRRFMSKTLSVESERIYPSSSFKDMGFE